MLNPTTYLVVQVLALRELNVYDEAVLPLASGLAASEHLRKLSLQYVDLSGNGWAALLSGVRGSTVHTLK